jgi:hypothetical protein
MWCETDNKLSSEHFLETTGLNIVTGNPESIVEVMSSIIGDDLIQLLTEQSNLLLPAFQVQTLNGLHMDKSCWL